jgi:hypothetical protein
MLRVAAVLFGVAVYIYFIIDVLRTRRGDTRSLPKFVWLLVALRPSTRAPGPGRRPELPEEARRRRVDQEDAAPARRGAHRLTGLHA